MTSDSEALLERINYTDITGEKIEHRNQAEGSLSNDPALVGTMYKDIVRVFKFNFFYIV